MQKRKEKEQSLKNSVADEYNYKHSQGIKAHKLQFKAPHLTETLTSVVKTSQ